MATDWIPRPDDEFHTFFTAYNAWVGVNGPTKGLTAGEVTDLADAHSRWVADYATHQSAQTAAAAARADKETARSQAEPWIRLTGRKLQARPDMSDSERAAAGLTIRDATPTDAAVPTTRPIAMVDTSQRLRHTISFKDETTPNSKKKPAGVMGVEVWCFVGPTPPPDASTCSFVALDTSPPYMVEYDGADGNKVAHYLLRWVNTRGEKGPWSETVSATIGA